MLNRYLLEPGRRAARGPPQGRGRPQDARGHRAAAGGDLGRTSSGARRPAREDAAECRTSSARSSATATGRAGDLREPARDTTSRRISTCPTARRRSPACWSPAATATTARRPRRISGSASCWPRTAWPRSATTRSARASGSRRSTIRASRVAGSTTEHTMAGIGALLVGRQAASYRDLGRHPQHSTTSPAGPRSTRPARLHRQLGRRHPDGLPDGPRRPDRRGGAVLLHHLAGAAVRHHRPAGRRAEHHRPGRLRHGPRRLRHHAGPEAHLDVRSAPTTSSTSRGAGTPSARSS